MKKFFIIIFIGILASCSGNSSENNFLQQEQDSYENIQNFCNSVKIGSIFDENFPNFSDFRLTSSQNSEFGKIESYSYGGYSSDICIITVQDSKIVGVNFLK